MKAEDKIRNGSWLDRVHCNQVVVSLTMSFWAKNHNLFDELIKGPKDGVRSRQERTDLSIIMAERGAESRSDNAVISPLVLIFTQ